METGRDNVNNNGVLDGVMDIESTEYSSHALPEVMDGGNMNDWILVTISRICK